MHAMFQSGFFSLDFEISGDFGLDWDLAFLGRGGGVVLQYM